MSTIEKKELKKKIYVEALRYMDNAKEALHKAKKHGNYYEDVKYVRTASGVAYSAMLLALDTWLELKNIHPPSKNRKSIEWYRYELSKMDSKLLNDVNSVYSALHLSGYYEGTTNVKIINAGLESALAVIRRIKPVVN